MSTRGRDGSNDMPYVGSLGTTRHEPGFITGPDGTARRVEVVRGVNTATDPVLGTAAREGKLNTVDGIGPLAVPFVYHDPAQRRFALVIPAARAHEELALRADLLARLASDAGVAIPNYVRQARAVVGPEGLGRYLAEPPEGKLAAEIETKLEGVAQREQRLRDRAEQLTHDEDDYRQKLEELDVMKADLQVREQELEQRLNELMSREEALGNEEKAMRANKNALAARERMIEARAEAVAAREHEVAAREHELVGAEESLGLRDQELAQREQTLAANVASAARVPPAAQNAASEPDVEAEALEPEDDVDAEPVEDAAPLSAEPIAEAEPEPDVDADAVEAHPLPAQDDLAASPSASASTETLEAEEIEQDSAETEEAEPVEPEPEEKPAQPETPPAWMARGQDAYAAVVEGEARVWTKGNAEHAARIAQGGSTLLLQADPDSKLPLALLTVRAEDRTGLVSRVVLDVTSPEGRAVLETLTRDFRVRLEVVGATGRGLGNHAVAAPGEANAQKVLAALSGRTAGSEEAHRNEAARLLREGVRSDEGETLDKAFADEKALATAAGVEKAAAVYEPLLDESKRDRLLLSHGIPTARFDALGKRLISAALRCGVRLPDALIARAKELGIAPDEKALVTRALNAYARACETEDGLASIGRTRREASIAWGPLLAWAQRAGAAVPDAARGVIRALFDPDDPGSVPPPDPRTPPTAEALSAMPDDELPRWSDHPTALESVAREMARRDPVRFAEPLARALRQVQPAAAAEIAAQMLRAGDALGDVWVELIGSQRAWATCIGAVATGVIHLRRGLNPVVQRALARDNPDWKLFAWAAGEFGSGVVRAVGRLDGVDADRLALILAHAVRAGGGRDVEKARSGSGSALADAATRAVGRVDEAREYDGLLRKGPGGSDVEQVARILLDRLAQAKGAGEARPG